MRCINCGIAILGLQKHQISSLSAHNQTTISRWMTTAQTQLPLDKFICHPCLLLLNTKAGQHERLLGHKICIGCGKSLIKIRHHNVSPMLALLLSQKTNYVPFKNNYICHVCWMQANKSAVHDSSKDMQELSSDNNAAAPNKQVVSPPKPPSLLPVQTAPYRRVERCLHSELSNLKATQHAVLGKSNQKDLRNSLCITCLSVNRRLCEVNKVDEMKTLFPDIKFQQSDRICWECKAMAKKCMAFRKRTYKAMRILQAVTNDEEFNTLQSLSVLKPVVAFCMDYATDPLMLEDSVKNGLEEDYGNYGIFVKEETMLSEPELTEDTDSCDEDCLRKEAGQSVDRSTTDAEDNIPINETEHSTYNEDECKITSEIISDSDNDVGSNICDINTTNNVSSNVGNKSSDKYRSKREGKLSVGYKEIRFITIKMTEEEMNKTRELDRKVQKYVSYTYKCQSCILGYYTEEKYLRHMEEKHSERAGQHKCPVCEVHFSRKSLLTRHYASHFKSYKCKECHFTNHKISTLLKHMKNLHEPVKKHDYNTCGRIFDFQCAHCDVKFSNKLKLRRHIFSKHLELYPNSCRVCPKRNQKLEDIPRSLILDGTAKTLSVYQRKVPI